MKQLATVAAASVLAAAAAQVSAAPADTYWSVAITGGTPAAGTISYSPTTPTGTATLTLDDATGALYGGTISTEDYHAISSFGVDVSFTNPVQTLTVAGAPLAPSVNSGPPLTLNYAWGSNTLDANDASDFSGSRSCSDGGSGFCSFATAGSPDWDYAELSLTPNSTLTGFVSGTLTAYEIGSTGTSTTVYTLTAVPIPAAAWLFGSGLIGLAGIARRRRAS